MNVLNKVILKDLKLNKKRTIVTIIGIILSTALICAVAGMITSVQKTLIESSKEKYGDFHVTFCNVPKDEASYIENNRNIEKYYLSEQLGYSKLKDSQNEDKPYLNLIAGDEQYLNNMGIKVIEGRLPKNDTEIIISESIIKNAKVNYKINDKIILDVSRRLSDGYELNQSNPYIKSEEYLEKIFTKEYTVVGIMERQNYNIEPYSAPGYTVITKLNNIREKVNVSVVYKNVYKFIESTEQINEMKRNGDIIINGFNYTYSTSKYNLIVNESLLNYEGVTLSDATMTVLVEAGAIVILIIIISSVFVIKNSFAISITEKKKQYGMFASVGATSKQIRKSVLFEGVIIGIIAIPIGIMCGIVAIIVLLWLVNVILGEQLNGIVFVYSVPILPIIISVILAIITIYLSAIGTARKASKVSPIEAIRSNEDIKIKSKKIKCPKLINRILGIGGEISYKNLKRNKKKYRTTIISIIVSVVIFISLSSFIEYGFKMSSSYYKEKNYNIMVYAYSDVNIKKQEDIYNKISKLENIKSYAIYKEQPLFVENIDKKLTNFAKDKLKVDEKNCISVVSIGDSEYKNYVKTLGGNIEKYSNGGILINTTMTYVNDKVASGEIYNIKEGEKLLLTNKSDDISNQEYELREGIDLSEVEKKDYTIDIVKVTDKKPMGLENSNNILGYLIVSDEFMEKIGITNMRGMYINSSNATKLQEDILNIQEELEKEYGNFTVVNYEEQAKAENSMVLVISIFLYGFIAVITLIGITNIFNTITTTMKLRSKEFAMLKSIGMTKKEFNRMIRLESTFYGMKALIIGIPIGIALSYLIYRAFLNSIEIPYIIPIRAISISIIFVLVLISIIMKFSINKINKQNIIETIRNDNI